MRRAPLLRALLLAALAAVGAGCSLLTSFDPESQPCDPHATREADKCLPGYACVGGLCKSADGGVAGPGDAGASDAGARDAGARDAGAADAGP